MRVLNINYASNLITFHRWLRTNNCTLLRTKPHRIDKQDCYIMMYLEGRA